MKSKTDKKVNRVVKRLNRELKEDVFGDRFWCRQVAKLKADDVEHYIYELKDREDPSRDRVIRGWLSGFEIITFHTLAMEMNDFIVTSNFWEEFKRKHPIK